MLDRRVFHHIFDLRIRDSAAVIEKGRKSAARYVAILVDCGGQYSSAMLSIPNRIVCAASKKGYAKRGASNDHVIALYLELSTCCLGDVPAPMHLGTIHNVAADRVDMNVRFGKRHCEAEGIRPINPTCQQCHLERLWRLKAPIRNIDVFILR